MNGSSTAVVMGIIDDGIAFANQRFRNGSNTRVEYWWLQDGAQQGPGTITPGRELTKAQINASLAACTRGGVLDEDQFYRLVGLTDFTQPGHKSAAWRIAHGTHVLDLASGYDPQAAPSDRPIVVVQLPVRVTADTSGSRLYPFVHLAVRYILVRAYQIAKDAPVVINLSYGNFAGPHDGKSPIETALDRFVKRTKVPLRIVLPAGNSYILRTHAEVSFPALNSATTLNWRILPGCRRPSFLEIWLPPFGAGGAVDRVDATITSPTGQALTVNENSGTKKQWLDAAGNVYAEAYYRYRRSSQRGLFLVIVKRTASVERGAVLAPAGVWTVMLQNQLLAPTDLVQAWIQRDDSLYGFPIRGRQSYFDDASYRLFDAEGRDNERDQPPNCVVRRASTLNAIATGAEPVVVGGVLRKEMVDAEYSSAGPVANAPRPDAVTVTEDSKVHYGVLAAGSRSGSVVTMGGTSVAVPQIARRIAHDLASGGSGDRTTVRYWATTDEGAFPAGTPASATPPPPIPDRSGAGRTIRPPHVRIQRYWGQF